VQPLSPAGADRSSPADISKVVLLNLFEIDTTRADDFADGLARTRSLLTDHYAAAVTHRPRAAPDAQWRHWSAHQAYTTAHLAPRGQDHPPDTAGHAYRGWLVTIRPHGRDGWHGEPAHRIALVTLTKTSNGWSVATIDFR
jgi:hypothetical protein